MCCSHKRSPDKCCSSVDKYRAEVKTGSLTWTPVHKSESFFREHAEKFAPLGKPMTDFDDLKYISPTVIVVILELAVLIRALG